MNRATGPTSGQLALFDADELDGCAPLPVRYSVAPLVGLATGRGWSRTYLRRLLRVSGSTWAGAMTDGIAAATADRWADRIGVHPTAVWEDW